jgi:hypothetical protein
MIHEHGGEHTSCQCAVLEQFLDCYNLQPAQLPSGLFGEPLGWHLLRLVPAVRCTWVQQQLQVQLRLQDSPAPYDWL